MEATACLAKAFIRGVPIDMNEVDLAADTNAVPIEQYFAKYGALAEVRIMRDSRHVSRGFAFVTFQEASSLDKALDDEHVHVIDGVEVKISRAMARDDIQERKIFVGGLPYDATSESLEAFFGKYGKVEHAEVKKHYYSGRPRGFGFVVFDTKESAADALELPKIWFGHKLIEVKKSEPKPDDVSLLTLRRVSKATKGTATVPSVIVQQPHPLTPKVNDDRKAAPMLKTPSPHSRRNGASHSREQHRSLSPPIESEELSTPVNYFPNSPTPPIAPSHQQQFFGMYPPPFFGYPFAPFMPPTPATPPGQTEFDLLNEQISNCSMHTFHPQQQQHSHHQRAHSQQTQQPPVTSQPSTVGNPFLLGFYGYPHQLPQGTAPSLFSSMFQSHVNGSGATLGSASSVGNERAIGSV